MKIDPRAETAYGERVPYVLIRSEDRRQVDRALSPAEFLADPLVFLSFRLVLFSPLTLVSFLASCSRLQLDVTHYITKAMIPPLERIFNLLGADVSSWYSQMKRVQPTAKRAIPGGGKPILLEEHFTSDSCVACRSSHAPDG